MRKYPWNASQSPRVLNHCIYAYYPALTRRRRRTTGNSDPSTIYSSARCVMTRKNSSDAMIMRYAPKPVATCQYAFPTQAFQICSFRNFQLADSRVLGRTRLRATLYQRATPAAQCNTSCPGSTLGIHWQIWQSPGNTTYGRVAHSEPPDGAAVRA